MRCFTLVAGLIASAMVAVIGVQILGERSSNPLEIIALLNLAFSAFIAIHQPTRLLRFRSSDTYFFSILGPLLVALPLYFILALAAFVSIAFWKMTSATTISLLTMSVALPAIFVTLSTGMIAMHSDNTPPQTTPKKSDILYYIDDLLSVSESSTRLELKRLRDRVELSASDLQSTATDDNDAILKLLADRIRPAVHANDRVRLLMDIEAVSRLLEHRNQRLIAARSKA